MIDATSTTSFRRARAAVTAAFAAHAVVAGSLGPWIPELKARSGLSDAGLGLALAAYAIGLVAGTRVAGPALRWSGPRRVVRAGIPALAAALATLPLASGLAAFASILTAIGVVSGLLDVAMNTEAVAVEVRYGRRVLSSAHGTWSASMLVGAACAALAIAAGIPIRSALPGVAIVLVASSAPILRWLPPGSVRDATTSTRGSVPAAGRRVVALCVLAFAMFLTESIASEWSAVFLREVADAGARAAGLGVVAFSAGMAVSRFAGDRLIGLFGAPRVVRVGTSVGAAAIGVAIATADASASLAGLAILGLGLGPAVPSAFGAAGRLWRGPAGSGLAIVVTAGYAGSIAGPLAVGLTSDRFGLRVAFAIPLAMCLIGAALAGSTATGGRRV